MAGRATPALGSPSPELGLVCGQLCAGALCHLLLTQRTPVYSCWWELLSKSQPLAAPVPTLEKLAEGAF